MSEYEGENRRQKVSEPMHLSKSVSVGHIVSTLGLFIAAAIAYSDFNQKVSDVVKDAEFNRELIELQKEQTQNVKKEIKEVVDQINQKLDRLIERQLKVK